MSLASLLVDDSAVATDLNRITVVTLDGRHELDAAVAVLVVVPIDERRHPLTGLVFGGKWLAGVIRPILHRPEQRFRVRVVIADARPRERPEYAQFLKTALQRGRTHGVAVVGWRISGCFRPLPIRSLKQALLTRSAAMAGSSRSATSQATTLRLQTSITR